MKTRITARQRVAAVLCASALTLSACASDGGSGAKDLDTADIYTTGLVDILDAGDPVSGGTLTVAEYGEAISLDPTKTYATGSTGMNVLASIYDTLMRYDVENGTFVPRLAESLETSDDTTWTLKLRQGVKFSDGTALDAKAVIASLEYYMANYGFQGVLIQNNLDSLTAPDALTVEFKLKAPWAVFPNMLASGPGMVMAPAAYKSPKAFTPIGAGPFTLDKQAQGEKTTVVANPDYFDGKPYLDKIDFVMLGADQAKWESLEAGEVDMAYVRMDDVVKNIRKAGYQSMVNAQSGIRVLHLNTREGAPTADPRVRQAVNLAIDAELFMQRTAGDGSLADRGLISDFSAWDTDVAKPEVDVEAAKKLLDEAKADGYDGKIRYLAQSDQVSKDGAVAIEAMLEAVGFEVEPDLVNNVAEVTAAVYVDADYDIAIGSTAIPDEDVYSRMYASLHPESFSNAVGYKSDEMAALLTELQAATGPEDGLETMTKIEELWAKDVPYITMAGGAFVNTWADNIHGVVPTTETSVLFDKVWISK